MTRTVKSYRIKVEQVIVEEGMEPKEFRTKETHSGATQEKRYGCGEEPVMNKEYEVREVPYRNLRTAEIYTQEVAAEGFDLVAVINAVNKVAPPEPNER